MINRDAHPVGWSLFLYELTDAQEHLGNLIREVSKDAECSEEKLRIDLGHVYAHLNRAWYRRNIAEDFPDADWESASGFPSDLVPIG